MEDAAALLCDWDGCLAIDNRLQPGVAECLRGAKRIAIISNNSTMNREMCRRRLLAEGIRVALHDIHLAGHTLLCEAAVAFRDAPVHLIASPIMRRQAEQIGLNLGSETPAAVLVLRDPRFDYARLEQAANHVRDGAHYWIANPDLHHPSGNRAIPETGALAQAITAVAGRAPDRIIGKPESLLFARALENLGLAPQDTMMIGDNPHTDIAGAAAANIPAMLVTLQSWTHVHRAKNLAAPNAEH
jgi:HAD superfamily hydrolase (TIGR01450 family)